jgi:hypothetical protein
MRVHFKGINIVHKKLADGSIRTYYYHRESGKRLIGQPGSPEFISSYGDAEKTILRVHHDDNFIALIRNFTLSIEFQQNLAPSTQAEYRRMLTKAEPEFGTMPIEALNDPRVRIEFLDWREKIALSSGKREADHRLSAISSMLTWAVDRGQLSANHLNVNRRPIGTPYRHPKGTPPFYVLSD